MAHKEKHNYANCGINGNHAVAPRPVCWGQIPPEEAEIGSWY